MGPLTTTTYYNAGFSKTVVDARGNTSTTSYQAFDTPNEDAIIAISAPEGLTVNIARDVFGKPTAITRSGTNPAGVYATATRSYVYKGEEGQVSQTYISSLSAMPVILFATEPMYVCET